MPLSRLAHNLWSEGSPKWPFHVVFLAIVLGATHSNAQTLLGRWTCLDRSGNREVQTIVVFDRNGAVRADKTISAIENGANVHAKIKYRAKFRIFGDTLIETNPRIKVRSYKIDGQKANSSPEAQQLHTRLLNESRMPAQILEHEERKLTLKQNERQIYCHSGGLAQGNPFCGERSRGSQCDYVW